MLALFLFLLLASSIAAQSHNQTLTFSDSALSFSTGWKASRDVNGDLIFVFDNVGVTALVVTLPPLTSHITYTGLGRTQGSLFGVCLDCSTDFTGLSVFDVHDPQLEDNALATPVDVFSLSLDPTQLHNVTILNIPDTRFNGQSELTFLSITVTIEDNGVQTTTTSSTTSTSSTSTSSTTTSTMSWSATSWSTVFTSSSTSSSSLASSSATAAASNALSSTTRNSIIAVIAILSFIGIGSLLLGLFFYRRRKRAQREKDELDDGFGRVGGGAAGGRVPGGRAEDLKGGFYLPSSNANANKGGRPPISVTIPPSGQTLAPVRTQTQQNQSSDETILLPMMSILRTGTRDGAGAAPISNATGTAFTPTGAFQTQPKTSGPGLSTLTPEFSPGLGSFAAATAAGGRSVPVSVSPSAPGPLRGSGIGARFGSFQGQELVSTPISMR
ncbi:hypothetical protein D9758_002413 [Tetrapyrgos nigripes]|uniref:Uncharacterized protein n=1 Tax=Tetrapyrgos nigripes TaxID=182062 RepID=A0A8H5GP92_9AGAR|nr:hypothetical protein D9758_002413 [Tetrapyrgos nigripes]